MIKYIFLLLALLLGVTSFSQKPNMKTLYDFSAKTIDGKDFNFSSLKGKKVLIVNTASQCGYTPQYAELEALYKEFGGEHFTIIGFPANNFGAQEPGTNEEIATFCTLNFGVTFPMMAKISVKGDDMDPLYHWLTSKSENGEVDTEVKWNFQKYLIDELGHWSAMVGYKESPKCEKILDWIKH